MNQETKPSSLPIEVHSIQKLSLDLINSVHLNNVQKTNFKLKFALTVFAHLPKSPTNIASTVLSGIGDFLSRQSFPRLESPSAQPNIEQKFNSNRSSLSLEQDDDHSGYVKQVAKYINQGVSILEYFPGNISNTQIEALNELQEGVRKFQRAESREINRVNNIEEVLALFEEANIHFQNSVRLSATAYSISQGLGGFSGAREVASGSSEGNRVGAGGGSFGGGSFGGGGSSGGGGRDDFSSGDDDSFDRFRIILQWIKEQAARVQVNFLETIKIARTITLKAMLRAASIVFRSVREQTWSQRSTSVDFYENEADVDSDKENNFEELLTLEERINKVEEDFNRNNKSVSQEIKVYIEKIQSFNMNNSSEPGKSNFDLRQTKFGGGFAAEGGIQIGGNFLDASSQQNLNEAVEQIQQLLNQLSQTYPVTTTSEQMLVATKALEKIEEDPDFKQRVVGALKSGGTEALKALIDHPTIHVLLAAMEGWQKPD